MRVLHVLDYSPPFPGAIVDYLMALGASAQNAGSEMCWAFPQPQPWNEMLSSCGRLLIMPSIRKPLRSGFQGDLRSMVRQMEVDLVHIWFSFALPFSLCWDPSPFPVPVVYHWQNPPRPLISTSACPAPMRAQLIRHLSRAAARIADRRIITCHVVTSSEIGGLLVEHRWTDPGKLRRIPNPLPRLAARAGATQRRGDGPVIGSIANFRPQKDHATLLRGFASFAQSETSAQLILIGDGPTRPQAETLARACGIAQQVQFAGFVKETGPWYQRFDIFALSTHYEGQGIVLLEAMAHGLPVVCTDLPSTRETITHGVDGLLVRRGDQDHLAQALSVLWRDPSYRCRIATAGQVRAQSGFSLDGWCSQLGALYGEILQTCRQRRRSSA